MVEGICLIWEMPAKGYAMSRTVVVALIFILSALALACGGGGGGETNVVPAPDSQEAATATSIPSVGASDVPGFEGSLSLDVPDSALPEGVEASVIRSQVLNVFELSEDVQRAVGDDLVLSVVSLQPDGVKFREPITFTFTVESENDAQLGIVNVSTQGAEELTSFATQFDGTRGVIVAKGEITHFSVLVAKKPKDQQTAKELVARGKARTDYLTAKAEGSTFWSEKARYYKAAVDAAVAVQRETLARFPLSPDIPPYGKNSYNESSNMQKYAEFITKEYDNLIANEPDPFARFDLLQERNRLTGEVHKFWNEGLGDERLAPTAGGNDLGEATALVEQGDSITQQIEDLINNEPNVAKANELRAKLLDIVGYLVREGISGAFDERVLGGSIKRWDRVFKEHSTRTAVPTATASPTQPATTAPTSTPSIPPLPTPTASPTQPETTGPTSTPITPAPPTPDATPTAIPTPEGVFEFQWPGGDCWDIFKGDQFVHFVCGPGRHALEAGTYNIRPRHAPVFEPFNISIQRGSVTTVNKGGVFEFQWSGGDCWDIFKGDQFVLFECGSDRQTLEAGTYNIRSRHGEGPIFENFDVTIQRGSTTTITKGGIFEFQWAGSDVWAIYKGEQLVDFSSGSHSQALEAGTYNIRPSNANAPIFENFDVIIQRGSTTTITKGGIFEFQWAGSDVWEIYKGEQLVEFGRGSHSQALEAGMYNIRPRNANRPIFENFDVIIQRGSTTTITKGGVFDFQSIGSVRWNIYRGNQIVEWWSGPYDQALEAGTYTIGPDNPDAEKPDFAPFTITIQTGQTTNR